MAKNNTLNASALLNTEVKTEVKTPVVNDGRYFVNIRQAYTTSDTFTGFVLGRAYNPDRTVVDFRCDVAIGTKLPPVTQNGLKNLRDNGFYTDYLDIQPTTCHWVTVKDGLVVSVERYYTPAELAKINAKRDNAVFAAYPEIFGNGGKQ